MSQGWINKLYVFFYKIGTTIWIASAFGYIVGLSNSFYFGKTWVFNPERVVYKHAIIKFVFIYSFGGLGMVLIITMLDSLTVMDYRVIWFFGAFFAEFVLAIFLGVTFFFETVFLALFLAIIHLFTTKRSGNMVSNWLFVKG